MGRRLIFDRFSQQALQTWHRYRAVMFSPTCRITIKKNVIRLVCKKIDRPGHAHIRQENINPPD